MKTLRITYIDNSSATAMRQVIEPPMKHVFLLAAGERRTHWQCCSADGDTFDHYDSPLIDNMEHQVDASFMYMLPRHIVESELEVSEDTYNALMALE